MPDPLQEAKNEQKKPAPASPALPACFPLPLRLERTAPFRAVTLAPFIFYPPSRAGLSKAQGRVEVEPGFDTDYASVPRALWNLYPPDGDYTPAAVIHDALYWHQATAEPSEVNVALGLSRPVTRAEADTVFFEAMQALGIPAVRRRILFTAVRLFGGRAWENNARHKAGLPTVEAARSLRAARRGPRSR